MASITSWLTHDPRIALTGFVLVIMLALIVIARIYAKRWYLMLAIGVLLPLIWIPRTWRDSLLTGAITLLVWLGSKSFGAALIVGGITALLAWIVPGGASVAVLGLVLLICFSALHRFVANLRQIRRARSLEPGTQPAGLVQLAGHFDAEHGADLPGGLRSSPQAGSLEPFAADAETRRSPNKVAAWKATFGQRTFSSTSMVRLVGDYGIALIDPRGLRFGRCYQATLKDEAATDVLRDLGQPLVDGQQVQLSWMQSGEAGYVRGIPDWRADDHGGGYRQSTLVPLFRAESEAPATSNDSSPKTVTLEGETLEGPVLRPAVACEESPDVSADRRQTFVAQSSLPRLITDTRLESLNWALISLACAAVVITQAIFD